MKSPYSRPFAALLFALGAISACSKGGETQKNEDFAFDGSCVNCHRGLSAKQVHGTYKLRCIDCHGGNDQIDIPAEAYTDEEIYRDPDLIAQSHVRPKPGLARFFYGNGIDDDGDGKVDEGPTFEDDGLGGQRLADFGEIAEPGLQGEGVGEFVDSEFNRDLNYTRWLNPGDLRVATIGCGSASAANPGSGCHQNVVESNRRSVMTNNSAVLNGAYYGNESWRATFQNARDAVSVAEDPRKGAFGYAFDYAGIDSCIEAAAEGEREQPRFDSSCLEAIAASKDPNAAAGAPGNGASNVDENDLPAFEATQGELERQAGVPADQTLAHVGGPDSRFPEWGGKPLKDPAASIERMIAPPFEDLIPGIPDPVDSILRGFRAYFPLNFPGSIRNQNLVFGQSISPGIDVFKTRNPFGRGHSAGCTSCHMKYNFDGSRDPQKVASVVDGKRVVEDVEDPTTKHREFDPKKHDVREIDGEDRLVGMTVTTAEREFAGIADGDQQKHYSASHTLTTQIGTEVCAMCHAFVTRIDLAYTGMAEDEQRDPLARRGNIEFVSSDGDQVRILDSWVREETIGGETTLVLPEEGLEVIEAAKERDAELAELGLLPGFGGCAPTVFTEDCNNNGRLDTELFLQRVDEKGNVVAETTINEDANGNGKLDLIDRAPREQSLDGRQMRYVYGGVNGATRLMDVHFERGMHCIDCHQLQDNHGDGHLYGTNHEQIEIECDDCHGSLSEKATLLTSGANGGNLMSAAVDQAGRPFFEVQGDTIVQRSRVTEGLTWEVPQLPDTLDTESSGYNARAEIAHSGLHLPQTAAGEDGFTSGSSFEGEPGASPLKNGKLECYSCHTSWVLNCMGCHDNTNLGDLVKKKLLADGSIENVAGENEVWFNNSTQPGATNFQLLGLMRSPFVLGTAASADNQRIATFRSSMIVHASINDPDGTLVDSINFSTFQKKDANSERENVATSGSAMNQTMPHTVRPAAVKSCEQCHSLVDAENRVRNDHILAETMGVGASRYPYLGDWAMMAGAGGLELFEHKQENQAAGSTGSSRFPGIILNPLDRVAAAVEPNFDGSGGVNAAFAGTDIALVRNFNPTPVTAGQTAPPTLRDLSVSTHSNGSAGLLLISDLSGRGHPSVSRPSVGDDTKVFVLNLPDVANALAHISPDVSDPYVYVANGGAGLSVVKLLDAPGTGVTAASLLTSVAIPSGAAALEVTVAGDIAYVGTDAGSVETFDLANPEAPVHLASLEIDAAAEVKGLALGGFTLYVGTSSGLSVLSIVDPAAPVVADGASGAIALSGFDIEELSYYGGKLYLAAGSAGLVEVDVTTAANPQVIQNLSDELAPGEVVDIQDAVVSVVPGQVWVMAADISGDMLGFKLDGTVGVKNRCYPNPQDANCGLDMDFRDPTIYGFDPSFDPISQTFDADDPSSVSFFRQAAGIVTSGRRLARPAYWEKINTHTGRRMRDSFMPGSGTLSLPVMQRMYGVRLCEVENSADLNGNGLGQLGFVDEGFLNGGECQNLSVTNSAQKNLCREGESFDAVSGRCRESRTPQAPRMLKR